MESTGAMTEEEATLRANSWHCPCFSPCACLCKCDRVTYLAHLNEWIGHVSSD